MAETTASEPRELRPVGSRPGVPWLSLGTLVVLLAVTPFVVGLPAEVGGGRGSSGAVDAHYSVRVAFVLLGMAATVVAGVALFATIRSRESDFIRIACSASLFLASAVIGWQLFPYWAAGAAHIGGQARVQVLPDPKHLPPAIWIGDAWRYPALLLYPLAVLILPTSMVCGGIALWRRRFSVGLVTLYATAVAAAFIVGNLATYTSWIMG